MQKVYIETTIPSYIVSKTSRDIIVAAQQEITRGGKIEMEWRDPIVEEVRKIREQLLEEHGGFDNFVKHLKEMEEKHIERVVKQKENKIMLKEK